MTWLEQWHHLIIQTAILVTNCQFLVILHIFQTIGGDSFFKKHWKLCMYMSLYRYYSDMTYHTHGLLRSLKKGRWNFFSGPGQFFYLTFFLSYGFIKVAAPFKEFSHPPLISYLDIYREFLVNVILLWENLHIKEILQ